MPWRGILKQATAEGTEPTHQVFWRQGSFGRPELGWAVVWECSRWLNSSLACVRSWKARRVENCLPCPWS